MAVGSAELIGYAAAFLSTVCWMPQAARVIRTRETKAISLPSQCLLTASIFLWMAYGGLEPAWPVFFCNVVSIVPITIVLVMKLRNVRRGTG